jgi:hypothetical protein
MRNFSLLQPFWLLLVSPNSKEKVESLEHSNKLLIEKNDKFQNDLKLSEGQTDLHSVSSKITMADVSSSFSSSESSTFYSVPDINLQGTKSRYLQESLTSYSDSRKPFPHFSETEELLTLKPFPPIENVVPGKLLPPCENVNPHKPFTPSEDGNNNKADDDNNRRNDAHEELAEDEVMHDQNVMEPEQKKAFFT